MPDNLPAQRVGSAADIPGSPVPARPVYFRYDAPYQIPYSTRTGRGSSYTPAPEPPALGQGGRIRRTTNWIDTHTPSQVRNVNVPNGLPRFLGNRNLIFAAWLVAMVVASADEIRSYGWAPRPARLWWVSLSYGLLLIASEIDALVPLVNALAVGYDMALLYKFWSGSASTASTGTASNSTNGSAGNASTGITRTAMKQAVTPGIVYPSQILSQLNH